MKSWLWKVTVLVLIQLYDFCPPRKGRSFEEVKENNQKLSWLVVISDVKAAKNGITLGIAYGAVIKPNLVISSASALSRSSWMDLRVLTDCNTTSRAKCDQRDVLAMIIPLDSNRENPKDSDWVVLILCVPFGTNSLVNPIELAKPDEDYDPEDCRVYRWRLIKRASTSTMKFSGAEELEFADYSMSLTSGIDEDEEAELTHDFGCVIENCYFATTKSRVFIKPLSFLGSPVLCTVRNSGSEVLAGFATLIYEVITDNQKQRNETLQENVTGSIHQFTAEDWKELAEILAAV